MVLLFLFGSRIRDVEASRYKSKSFTKALTNYQLCNGRMQNSLLSSLLCSAIDGWISNYESINGTMYIKEKKVMNSAYGHYGPDSLLVL